MWPFARRPRPTLSVCIITEDRREELRGCLRNVSRLQAGEIVVVDGGSTDGSESMARSVAGVRWIVSPWPGSWARQKNIAYDAARGDWILNVDTDERVGRRLARRLPRLIAGRHDVYRLRLEWVSPHDPNQVLRGGSWGSCYIPRLFRNVPEHRWVEDERCHPGFPPQVVRRMRKVRRGALDHLIFQLRSREELEARMAEYEALDPGARATNEKYYPWWRIPHWEVPIREGWAE